MAVESSSPAKEIFQALSKCQESGDFTDLTLECEGRSFKVHKVIVCSQSDVIHAACTGNFKEASTSVYKFLDESELCIEGLVSFLYTADYDENLAASASGPSESVSCLQLHARLFALGEKYHIRGLKELCTKKYKNRLESARDAVEFFESIPDAYTSTPTSVRALREVITRFAEINIADFMKQEDAEAAYDNAAVAAPEFVRDLLGASYIKKPGRWYCQHCGRSAALKVYQF